MPVTKTHTARKSSKTNGSVKRAIKSNSFDEVVLFPEKVDKINELLDKAILIPHGKIKNNKKEISKVKPRSTPLILPQYPQEAKKLEEMNAILENAVLLPHHGKRK